MAGKNGNRPLGITILALLSFIGAIISLVAAFAAPVLLTSISSAYASVAGGLLMVVGVIGAIIGLVVGYGLWTGRKWAWWLEVILSVLSILSILTLNIVAFVIGIIIVYYMTRKNVKAYFGM